MSEVVRLQRQAPQRSRLARVFGVSPLLGEARKWYRGALGELHVGDALDDLGPEWDVLHAVPVGHGIADIDHVAIGPTGVFTITTKNHSGQEVWVNGHTFLAGGRRQHHVRDAQFEAGHAANLLASAAGRDVLVSPVIAVVNPKRLVVREQPSGVTVVAAHQLVRWMTRLDTALGGEEVAFISDVADRASTWQAPDSYAEDTQQLHREFSLLRAEVTAATRRRVAWITAGALLLCATIWSGTAYAVSALIVQ